jgi:hypothetical protein
MVTYRYDPDYTTRGRHYAHPLIDWPTVIAGVLIAVAIGFLLNVLGLAIGASAFNPYRLNAQDDMITVAGGLYVIFAQLVALQIGAYVASRASRYPDHFGGLLTGLVVWALAVFLAIGIASFTAGAASSGDAIPGGVAETMGELTDAARGEGAAASELESAANTADAVASLAWWTLASLGLGLAGAIAGGWLGAAHPKWEGRPRLDDSRPYQTGPEI